MAFEGIILAIDGAGGLLHRHVFDQRLRHACCAKGNLFVVYELMVSGQDKKILIVEKQPNYTQQLVKQVLFAGLSPVVAVTGEGGLRKAMEHHPALILLELDLTDMAGLRFVSLLKERESLQKIPIVAMSIVGQMKDEALKGGCNDFMGKPVKMIELMAHIRRFIYGSPVAPMKSLG